MQGVRGAVFGYVSQCRKVEHSNIFRPLFGATRSNL